MAGLTSRDLEPGQQILVPQNFERGNIETMSPFTLRGPTQIEGIDDREKKALLRREVYCVY